MGVNNGSLSCQVRPTDCPALASFTFICDGTRPRKVHRPPPSSLPPDDTYTRFVPNAARIRRRKGQICSSRYLTCYLTASNAGSGSDTRTPISQEHNGIRKPASPLSRNRELTLASRHRHATTCMHLSTPARRGTGILGARIGQPPPTHTSSFQFVVANESNPSIIHGTSTRPLVQVVDSASPTHTDRAKGHRISGISSRGPPLCLSVSRFSL